jgi:hypothetical protein
VRRSRTQSKDLYRRDDSSGRSVLRLAALRMTKEKSPLAAFTSPSNFSEGPPIQQRRSPSAVKEASEFAVLFGRIERLSPSKRALIRASLRNARRSILP